MQTFIYNIDPKYSSVMFIMLKNKNKRKGQMSLEMIIGLIILLVVAAVVIKIFMDKMSGDALAPPETLELEAFRQHCDALCTRYVDTNFAGAEALAYCEKSFEIDLNKNGKIPGEAWKLEGYGLCEDRVYCFNIKECNWGSSERSRLSPEKCKDIMCDVYTERYGDNNVTAAEYIETKIEFGSCDYLDEEISFFSTSLGTDVTLASWHQDIYQTVHCRGA